MSPEVWLVVKWGGSIVPSFYTTFNFNFFDKFYLLGASLLGLAPATTSMPGWYQRTSRVVGGPISPTGNRNHYHNHTHLQGLSMILNLDIVILFVVWQGGNR